MKTREQMIEAATAVEQDYWRDWGDGSGNVDDLRFRIADFALEQIADTERRLRAKQPPPPDPFEAEAKAIYEKRVKAVWDAAYKDQVMFNLVIKRMREREDEHKD